VTAELADLLRSLAAGQPARLHDETWDEWLSLVRQYGTAHAGRLLALTGEGAGTVDNRDDGQLRLLTIEEGQT
jgi:hypothetical protein